MDLLNRRIKELEKQVMLLNSKMNDISRNVEQKSFVNYTKGGGIRSRSNNRPVNISSGYGNLFGGIVIWNNAELKIPRFGEESDIPAIGYNKHSHSRFSGGALISGVLEIVEYDWEDIKNKHSQQFLPSKLTIATTTNSKNEKVNKIGILDLIFNADTSKWGTAAYEIDIEKCYFVKRDENGDIALDENGEEMKSPLYNEDSGKTSIIWDKVAKCWRLYAVYAPQPDES